MKNAMILTALLTIVALCSVPVIGETLEPLTVSPGAVDRVTGVEVRCPTFSWQAVPGAMGYEVAVYELPPQTELVAWSLDDAVEVLFVELPSGVTAWTPSFESGLSRGADHVWFVRGVFEDGSADRTPWSQARFFRVVGGTLEPGIGVQSREVGVSSGEGEGEDAARSRGSNGEHGRSAMEKRVGEENTKDVGTAMAAIRGEMPDATGETYGVVGTSNSIDGAGLGAVNTAGGPDLVLDGAEDGETDTNISQGGVDRVSADSEAFRFINSGSGVLSLWVEGLLSAETLMGDGSGVTSVDAETLDGHDSTAFSPTAHLHDDRYYTEGELNTSGGGGSVHWDNLGTVPAGFADGIDHDTTYSAGTGLDLTGTVFSSMGTGFGNVVVVAASGGDFTSIQAAIDSVIDASDTNPYLVWVAPGVYVGSVIMKPHVHLQGSGQEATVVTSLGDETTRLASDSSVRDLTALNGYSGAGQSSSLEGAAGIARSLVASVTARAQGTGWGTYGVYLEGSETEVVLRDVTAKAENGSSDNFGIFLYDGASAVLRGGSYTGLGGNAARGIDLFQLATVEAEQVSAQADGGTYSNIALGLVNSSTGHVAGGVFLGRGGTFAYGIYGYGGSSLNAVSVTALGENGSDGNYGVLNTYGATATVQGGFFGGRGGQWSNGILNQDTGSSLEATNVVAHGEDGSNENRGLRNETGATADLRGGEFTGSGGEYAFGIQNSGAGAEVEAVGVTASGVNATYNRGIEIKDSAAAVLQGGRYAGQGGNSAYGIHYYYGTSLDATGLTAVGTGAPSSNRGLTQWGSTVRLGSTQLVGGAYRVSGTLTCVQVIDGNFTTYTCP